MFLNKTSCHKITHAHGYYGSWLGWAVLVIVFPLRVRLEMKWIEIGLGLGNPAEGQQEVSTSKGPWKLLEASEPNLLSRPCWYLPMDFLYLSPGNLLNTLKGRTAVIQQNAEKRGTAWNVAVVKFMRASRGRQQRLGTMKAGGWEADFFLRERIRVK